ncbi:DUF559 domain-containing protein [Streptomyces sp. ISL-90]|nr:DUF559 domain-containing protein [Streptomyces sp. ISL-90]
MARRIRENGGALSYASLDAAGVSRHDVAAALRAGAIVRVRNGWFAYPGAPLDVVRAARVGGALTGASVARLHGLWLLDDPLLHVRVPSSSARLRAPDDRRISLDRGEHGVCVHYRPDGESCARDPLPVALAEMFPCSGPVGAMIALDSALNSGELTSAGLAQLRGLVSAAHSRLVDRADPGCQSGLETIARLLLYRRRVAHRTQVWIPGVGYVDLLIGDRLVVELDGRSFHEGEDFETDHRRDFELALRGYVVVRISYRMIIDDWEQVEAGILTLLARGEHRWGHRASEVTARDRS